MDTLPKTSVVEQASKLIRFYDQLKNAHLPVLETGSDVVRWEPVELNNSELDGLELSRKALSVRKDAEHPLTGLMNIGIGVGVISFVLLPGFGGSAVLIGMSIGIILFITGVMFLGSGKTTAKVAEERESILRYVHFDVISKSLQNIKNDKAVADHRMLREVSKRSATIKQAIFHKPLTDSRIDLLKKGLKLTNTALKNWTSDNSRTMREEVRSDYAYFSNRWEKHLENVTSERSSANTSVHAKPLSPGSGTPLNPKNDKENPPALASAGAPQGTKTDAPEGRSSSSSDKKPTAGKSASGEVPPLGNTAGSPAPNPPVVVVSEKDQEITQFDPASPADTTNSSDHTLKTELGLLGEQYVLKYETKRIKSEGKKIKHLRHISTEKSGDRYGYDIYSETTDGTIRRIEVKTTKANQLDGFFISDNELNVLRSYPDTYYVYRLSDYDEYGYSDEKFIVDEILGARLLDDMELVPKSYKVVKKLNQ